MTCLVNILAFIFPASIELFLSGKSLVFINRFLIPVYSNVRAAEGGDAAGRDTPVYLFKLPQLSGSIKMTCLVNILAFIFPA